MSRSISEWNYKELLDFQNRQRAPTQSEDITSIVQIVYGYKTSLEIAQIGILLNYKRLYIQIPTEH